MKVFFHLEDITHVCVCASTCVCVNVSMWMCVWMCADLSIHVCMHAHIYDYASCVFENELHACEVLSTCVFLTRV